MSQYGDREGNGTIFGREGGARYEILGSMQSLYMRKEESSSPGVWMTIYRGFIMREGARMRRRGQREMKTAVTTTRGIERRGRGPNTWRTPLTTTRYTGIIASRQGTSTTNAKYAKDDDDEEGRMVGIPQFWVRAMGHMEAVA